MPQAIRSNAKATKIVYTILGKPMNMDQKKPFDRSRPNQWPVAFDDANQHYV